MRQLWLYGQCAFHHLQEEQLALLEALEQVPLKVRLEEQEGILGALTPEELAGCALDLRPFMQRTPFVLQARLLL